MTPTKTLFRLSVSKLLLASNLILAISAFAQTSDQSEEQKVLELLVGTWETEGTAHPSKYLPNGRLYKGRLECTAALDGHMIQGTGHFTRDDGSSSEVFLVWTYSKRKQAYQWSQYVATGNTNQWTGQWDTESNSFTWEEQRDNGLMDLLTFQFTGTDSIEVKRTLKDSEGILYLDLDVNWTRVESQPNNLE